MEDSERELQLLSTPSSSTRFSHNPFKPESTPPELNLSLSMNIGDQQSNNESESDSRSIQALKKQTAEQMRLAAAERAYAERVRELTRREIELAEKEFARARMMWERAREEMERVERLKVAATRRIGSTCIEVTCQACRQRFQP